MKKEKFSYFVSYKWDSKNSEGYGNTGVFTNRKMDADLIREIEKKLDKERGVGETIIISFQLFEQNEEEVTLCTKEEAAPCTK
jgi:hypothetical protein